MVAVPGSLDSEEIAVTVPSRIVRAVGNVLVVTAIAAPATAKADSFAFTGGEQTYTVPAGTASVRVVAVGGGGGNPAPGEGVPGGRAAVVSGVVAAAGGQVLFVHVGGSGGRPQGGFNGGGNGAVPQVGLPAFGGGGASDVSTVASSAGVASLNARLIVAAGGGGSSGIAAGGGDAGAPGGCCGAAGTGPGTAQPGTQTSGGAGGCAGTEGCGGAGTLGRGGDGAASGAGADARQGGGGGGGLFGGGGGAGSTAQTGGGAGGSSLVPNAGTAGLAPAPDTPGSVEITVFTTTADSRKTDPTKLLKTMAVQVSYRFRPINPRRFTRLGHVILENVPPGSKVVARCRTKAGGKCRKKLRKSFTKRHADGRVRIRAFERRYPVRSRLEIRISHPDYLTQVKTLVIRRHSGPRIVNRCELPDSKRLTTC
jgi:hypothetical protein